MERKKIILICNACLSRNYSIFKSQNSIEKLEIKKHCPQCNKHTLHKETR